MEATAERRTVAAIASVSIVAMAVFKAEERDWGLGGEVEAGGGEVKEDMSGVFCGTFSRGGVKNVVAVDTGMNLCCGYG